MRKSQHRVIFAEQFYYPDGWGGAQLPRDITTDLALAGWRVDVVCGSDPYVPVVGEAQPDPASAGVRIRRVARLLPGDIKRFKVIRQCWYYAIAIPLLLFSRASIYVVQTNPPLIVPIAALVAFVRRHPLVIIAQDLYPEVLFAHGVVSREGAFGRTLGWLFRWSYRRAMKVISLGPYMSTRLARKGVNPARIAEISNWATGDESVVKGAANKLRKEWGLEGKLVVLYSGNLGIAHDVETPIAAVAKALASVPNLALVFVGKGSRTTEALSLVAQYGIKHAVQFRPFVPFELLPHSLGLADIALVTLRPGFEGLVVPSKLLGHLCRGIPTCYVGPPSDIEHLITESGGGFCVANNDVGALGDQFANLANAKADLEQMGASGKRYYESHLAKSIGLARYSFVLDELVGVVNPLVQEDVR